MKLWHIIGIMFATGCAAQEREPCAAPEGVGASPRSIKELVYLIDSLPKPTTVECLVESFERPLYVVASSSRISAQPAAPGAPRLFAFFGDELTVSWVPEGPGSSVLEFSERREGNMSVKGELRMPVESTIRYEMFSHINWPANYRSGTICSQCHQNEIHVGDMGLGGPFFASGAVRVDDEDRVKFSDLARLAEDCDNDERRCAIFRATFDHGEVIESSFPAEFPTVFEWGAR